MKISLADSRLPMFCALFNALKIKALIEGTIPYERLVEDLKALIEGRTFQQQNVAAGLREMK